MTDTATQDQTLADTLYESEVYRNSVMEFVEKFGKGSLVPGEGKNLLELPTQELTNRTFIYGIATGIVGSVAGGRVFATVDQDITDANAEYGKIKPLLDLLAELEKKSPSVEDNPLPEV